jgi:uncharacterized repeat protein (TIGR01451 family)
VTLSGAILALPGVARAQAGVPAPPAPDAVASPPGPDSAHTVIASNRLSPATPVVPVPVPDDGLTPGIVPPSCAAKVLAPAPPVRTAEYRTEVDSGPIQQVGAVAAPRERPGASLDLRVESPPAVLPGRPFVYVIRVQSVGGVTAASVRVADRLPPGARLLGADPRPEVAGDRITWDLGDLSPGMERRIQVAIDAGRLAGEFAAGPFASFGVSPGPRVAAARPGLELRLTGPGTAPPGAVVPYRVQVANNGPSPQNRVVVRVNLSPGLRHPRTGGGNAVEAEITLAAGETKTLPLDLTAGAAGPNLVAASARADGGQSAEARAAVYVERAVSAPAAARLAVEAANQSEGLTVDGTAVYEIRVRNTDNVAATGVRVLAVLSEGLEPEQGDGPSTPALAPHGVVFETLPRLNPGEMAIYHLRARARRAGVQQLRAEVNADGLARPATAEANAWVTPGRPR